MEDFLLTDEEFQRLKSIIENDEFVEVPVFDSSEQFVNWIESLLPG